MSTPFGPQLIGETEKTLNALLRRFLEGTGLTEPQWVTLRLADLLDGSVGADGLAAAVADRAHFADAADLVGELTDRGLLDDGRLTSAGRELTAARPGHDHHRDRRRSGTTSPPTTSPPRPGCSTRSSPGPVWCSGSTLGFPHADVPSGDRIWSFQGTSPSRCDMSLCISCLRARTNW